MPLLHRLTLVLTLCGFALAARAQDETPVEIIISIADQKMVVVREGGWLKKYSVSTSRFGIGDNFGSYKTPVGRLRVCEKVGGELAAGAVLKHREATGEILQANAPGRDPIVSRILWLEGLEAQNDNARARGIYIHGTNEEAKIGKPVSWGCIRMRSQDVLELYEIADVGANVVITAEDLPRFPKWKPAPPPVIIAAKTPPAETPKVAAAPAKTTPAETPKIAAVVLKSTRPAPPVVAEILRPADDTPARSDPAAMVAFKGSILFAGLPDAPKPLAKPATKSDAKPSEQVAKVLSDEEKVIEQRASLFR